MKAKGKKEIVLTTKDLLKACDLAEESIRKGDGEINSNVPIPGDGEMRYAQRVWVCGTACCLHGFAGLSRGMSREKIISSGEEDDPGKHYSDLGKRAQLRIWDLLGFGGTTPKEVRQVILGAMKRRKKNKEKA